MRDATTGRRERFRKDAVIGWQMVHVTTPSPVKVKEALSISMNTAITHTE